MKSSNVLQLFSKIKNQNCAAYFLHLYAGCSLSLNYTKMIVYYPSFHFGPQQNSTWLLFFCIYPDNIPKLCRCEMKYRDHICKPIRTQEWFVKQLYLYVQPII